MRVGSGDYRCEVNADWARLPPGCIFIDAEDRENNRIQIFDSEGSFLRQWEGFLRPDKLWFDKDETIFMAEIGHRISVLNRDGQLLAPWGEAGQQPHQFRSLPHGIWGDSKGDILVSEVGSDAQLKKFVRV